MQFNRVVGKLCLLLLITALTGAQAATFYVSTAGSDSNPGTATQPFRTITYAYSLAGPGTTILVAPGTYTDYQSGWGLHLGSSGTASSPIVLESQVRGGAIIDGQFASDRNKSIYLDGSYNVIEGFVITRAPNTGIFVVGNSNQILDNEIYNNGTQGSTDPEGQGIYSDEGTSGNVYDGNYIHDNGYAGSNLDHGLYLCGQNEVVINNVVIRNASRGLQIAGYAPVSNMKVYNNVFAWNGGDGITVWMAMNGVDIRNNIIYNNNRDGVEFWAATGSGVVMDHNLIYGNVLGNYTSFSNAGSTVSYTLGTTISSDPIFANETSSGFDAHLSAGSPAIGAGYNFYSVFTADLAGAARSSSGAWDLGAYVYASTSITPPTVNMTSPTNGTTISGSIVTVMASASSSAGIAGVQFQLDGTNIGSVFTNIPYGGAWNSTTVADGAHTFTAVATDMKGNQTTATPVTFLVSNNVSVLGLPSISLAATSPNASRVGPTDGRFTITRSGDTTVPLIVYCSLGGTAVNGADYAALGTSLTIPAGAASAAITVAPLPSTSYVGTETAVLTLSANSTYAVGPAGSATVTIAGNSVPCKLSKAPGGHARITWNSVVGKVYGVAYKNSLSDATWT
ncbi:MAG: right-handed parallel beta-helix repeat-containing protein, partial [Limisphaerales bacterium]